MKKFCEDWINGYQFIPMTAAFAFDWPLLALAGIIFSMFCLRYLIKKNEEQIKEQEEKFRQNLLDRLK